MRSKKLFSFALIFLLLVSAVGVNAFAEEAESEYDFIINDFDSTYYNDGRIVFNNYGTVYNNGNCGVVYNNGGVVYNNGGTVYNNCGVVYNNSGTVFNNCGEVAVNGKDGTVIDNTEPKAEEAVKIEEAETVTAIDEPTETEETAETEAENTAEAEEMTEAEESVETAETAEETTSEEQEKAKDGRYKISLAADYSRFAYMEGPDKSGLDYYMTDEDEIIITAKPGFTLTNSAATTGRCTMQEDGSVVFGSAERDGMLYLAFSVDVPVITPQFGVYGEAVSVKIIVPNGVTVYYSTDGESIVNESCPTYDGPIEITSSSALQVMAAAEGAESSRVVSGRYLIPIIKAPTFSPLKKGYASVDPQAITVENTGLDKLKIESVRLTGNDAECFDLSTENGARISPGQRDRETWTVSPVDGLSPGTYKAAAEFTFSEGGTAEVELSFTVIK